MSSSPHLPPPVRLGDFTTDRGIFRLIGFGACAGLFGVVAGWTLLRMIGLINDLVYYGVWSTRMLAPGGAQAGGHPGLWTILVPAGGAVLIGLMARYGSEKIRGHGIPEAIEAILLGGARLDLLVAILKPISSAISIGTGGPFGAEGPIIMTGGAAASLMAQCFTLTDAERKTLLVAGACAGMTAVFGTPVAAILLAVELLLFELKPRSIIPVGTACITAAILRRFCMTPAPLFPYAGGVIVDPLHALGWLGLGLAAGFGSALLTVLVYAAEDGFNKLPVHWMWWPALGGLVVGIGGMADPAALGVGYPDIARLLAGALAGGAAIRLVLVKGVIWSVALGSGTSGGVLAPLLIIGGALGAVLAPVMPHAAPGFWAVLGMAAMMGGTMRAPLTSTLFAVELTGNHLILLPVLTASMASMAVTVLLMKRSILTEKIARRGHHLTREYSIDPLAVTRIRDIMATRVDTLGADLPIGAAIERFLSHAAAHRAFPVTEPDGVVLGLVSRADILDWIGDEVRRDLPLRAMIAGRKVVTAAPDEMADAIAVRMLTRNAPRIPVVDTDGRLLGLVSRADLLRVHQRVMLAETRRERFFSFRRRAGAKEAGKPEPLAVP
ncbi:unnamed protein product [Acidocella sp. C78]|uniref:chloride channel protein n=1 Tax=Acidocella sp. C78 TaxID=1671486 RepID=UPI00191BB602|nr:chloride channel protein [Acidocella sp. C78]CAG4918453.1 unnamed protein product [Acidocella sp. C78]